MKIMNHLINIAARNKTAVGKSHHVYGKLFFNGNMLKNMLKKIQKIVLLNSRFII